jgi:putative phosphoesterase
MAVPDDEAGAPTPAGTRLGVIADNHGYLDPRVLELFAGVARILHAGDVIDPEILVALEVVAPLTAVAGNMDPEELAARLPREMAGEACGVRFALGHKYKRLTKLLAAGKIEGLTAGAMPDLVVYGHDHTPATAWIEGTLYLNPGSASAPEEEDDDPTVAIVEITPAGLAAFFFPLERQAAGEATR